MSVTAGFMVPHPPLIIPEVGRGQQNKIEQTVSAYHRVAREVAAQKPDTVIILSPHSARYEDYFHIRPQKMLSGDFGQFGAGQVAMEAACDTEFVKYLESAGEEEERSWGTLGGQGQALDHGTLVPLYFINQYWRDYRLVSIGLSGLPLSVHYQLGQAIQETAKALGRRTVVVASGDLSHYLKADGPYGYHEEGPVYDEKIMDIMGRAAFGELLEFPETFLHRAGECGHRAFVILAGALDGCILQTERLSYEGTFGVGYGICTYMVAEKDEDACIEKDEDAYIALARKSLEYYVNTGRTMEISDGLFKELPKEMTENRAGTFVSIHQQKDGRLRGCIGTIAPVYGSIAEEIVENAVSAGVRDPRFRRVAKEELPELVYSVDVLGKPEKIDSLKELDVKNYGVIVTKGRRRGLLLPDLAGVDTPEQQAAIAKEKAGISVDDADVCLERFQVIRHGKKS